MNYENQILAATYDTYVAEAQKGIGYNQAELTRFGGAVSSSNILAQSTADYATAQAGISATMGSSFSSAIGSLGSAASYRGPNPDDPRSNKVRWRSST